MIWHLDQRWRNPNLIEILEYLDHDDPRIRLNAAAYLQHLTYEDQAMKVKARENRAVNIITKMLDSTEPEMKKHLLGILRNMSFGKGTIENKVRLCCFCFVIFCYFVCCPELEPGLGFLRVGLALLF